MKVKLKKKYILLYLLFIIYIIYHYKINTILTPKC